MCFELSRLAETMLVIARFRSPSVHVYEFLPTTWANRMLAFLLEGVLERIAFGKTHTSQA
jgi:hypothetical protein